MKKKSNLEQERVNIQLAPHLLDWIDEQRKPSGITRSAYIATVLADAMQRQKEVEAKD